MGNLYVAGYTNDMIEAFTPSGVGSVFASGLSLPAGLAFDSGGNLYVANQWNGTIEKFTTGGTGSIFASGLDYPTGLAFDTAGNLYVASYGNNTIEKYTPGGVGSVFATNGLSFPQGLAFDSAGNLYAANWANNTVEKLTPSGVGSVFASTGLNYPLGLAFDSAGNLYVANEYGSTIEKFTPGGVGSVFARGLDMPTFVAIQGTSGLGAAWIETTGAAPWTARGGFGAVVYNGKMYVLGGWNNGGSFNDVWSSSDGTNWTKVTSAAPWTARRSLGAVAFNGRLWVLGGINSYGPIFNDVWSSPDGTNWTQVTASAPWSARYGFGAVVYNGKMYVLGGSNNSGFFSDVWSSSDGTNWTKVTASAPWGERYGPLTVANNGLMYLLGGAVAGFVYNTNDVWSSSDGTNWAEVTSAALWTNDLGNVVAYNGQMYVLGSVTNDVYSSTDGTNWTKVTASAPWSARVSSGCVAMNGQLWLLGGGIWNLSLSDWNSVYNDVWYSPMSSGVPMQITAIARQGNDIRVTWTGARGLSYILQSTKSTAMVASYNTNYADASPVIAVPGVGYWTTNYVDVNAAYAPPLTSPGSHISTTSTLPSTVQCSAQYTRGLADSLGQAIPVGSLLYLGTFSISEPTIQSNFCAGNLSAIMSAFTPYTNSFAVGNGTGEPASWDISQSAAGFDGQQIYLLAIDTPAIAAATHMGIFTAPSWLFPSNGGTNTIDLEDVTDFVIGAHGGPLTISLPLNQTYTFGDTARLSVLPGRVLFYRLRLGP